VDPLWLPDEASGDESSADERSGSARSRAQQALWWLVAVFTLAALFVSLVFR
jgi:hypothetical protein